VHTPQLKQADGGALHIPQHYIMGPTEFESEEIHPPIETGKVELRTVQAVVQRAVREVVREPVELFGASRTDAGVHARGQVAAFTTTDDAELHEKGVGWPAERGCERLLRAINGKLPHDVQVTDCRRVRPDFDPVGDCQSKAYVYRVYAGRDRPFAERERMLHVFDALDVPLMQQTATMLVGTHDFAAFASAGHGRQNTVRTVLRCEVLLDGRQETPGPRAFAKPPEAQGESAELVLGQRIRIEVSGTGFLYNMVRIISGTLVEVGKGKMTMMQVERAIAERDRRIAGPTLPAHGLCLEWIRY
jgi:tRNA pseudouridine38-40 synthase